jgi:hypothetical protein
MNSKEKQPVRSLESTFKSSDTEEWFDVVFNRPIGFWWAKLFERMGVHPNVVTILSIIIGTGAGICFYFTDFWINLLGVALLVWANFYDSADGQLARMTGKKTLLGRILDGFSADVWFYTIYFCICMRLMPQNIPGTDVNWSYWIFLVAAISGLECHRRQCSLADYYRNIHLFFLKGVEGSELDNFKQQREKLQNTPKKGNFWLRAFLWGYGNYTHQQEGMTPAFQKMMQTLDERFGTMIPQSFRDEFREGSKPLMKYTNILTHNTRATVLFISCLVNLPWIYFLFEMTVLNIIVFYMHNKHEKLCRRMTSEIEADKFTA